MELSRAWGECNEKEGGKAERGKRREKTTIDFRRIVYSQLPRYIVFDLHEIGLFDVLGTGRAEKLLNMEPNAQEVRAKCMRNLGRADVRELAIHRRVRKVSYSRRCAEASTVKAYREQGLSLVPGIYG
jgi:hypothetical protein